MKTTKDPSIRLTIICVYVFAAILLLADIFVGLFAVVENVVLGVELLPEA